MTTTKSSEKKLLAYFTVVPEEARGVCLAGWLARLSPAECHVGPVCVDDKSFRFRWAIQIPSENVRTGISVQVNN